MDIGIEVLLIWVKRSSENVTIFLALKNLSFFDLKHSSQHPQFLQTPTTYFLTSPLLLRLLWLLRLFEFEVAVVVVLVVVVVVTGDEVWLALHKQIIDWQIEQIIIPSF